MLDEYGDDRWGEWAENNIEELMLLNHETRAGGAKTLEATRAEARILQEKVNKRKRRKNCLMPAIGLVGLTGAIVAQIIRSLN